jgi:hypothetical protein
MKNTRTTKGRFWTVARSGSNVVFDWRLSRRHAELISLVNSFSGVLQSDGYQAYGAHTLMHTEVTWVCCWAYTLKSFSKHQGEKPKTVREVLRLIARVYFVERE